MFYKLAFDTERTDKAIEEGTNTVYAEKSNLDEINYKNIKKGYFCYSIVNGEELGEWPSIEFYYSSKASSLESEYLLNSARWPIVHSSVKGKFEEVGITGVQYLPVKLIDVVTNTVNENYFVMNILNLIEAYNMEESEFTYNEKYNLYTFLPHNTVLDSAICSEYDIFRANKNKMVIYVSEKVRNIIEENKWIGFEFYKQRTDCYRPELKGQVEVLLSFRNKSLNPEQ